jgi:hypothetical protein
MKAYHLDKARDPSDLPDWLFEEHERRPAGRSRFRPAGDNAAEYEKVDQSRPPRSRSLRDVYPSAKNSDSLRSEPAIDSSRFGEGPGPSRPTNRLKELRDAKRVARAASTRHDGPTVNFESRLRFEGDRHAAVDTDTRLVPRHGVGLPSGPTARRL